MRQVIVLTMASLLLSAESPVATVGSFDLPEPNATGRILSLWSTRYYVAYVAAEPEPAGRPLLKRDGTRTGVAVSNDQFCHGAMQGTIAVEGPGERAVYNVNGLVPQMLAKCTYRKAVVIAGKVRRVPDVALNQKLGRQAWMKMSGNGIYGLGVNGMRLMPFRTVAVDRSVIPIGTVLYIPRLRGEAFQHDGVRGTHDGYVIAGDVGSKIIGNHIDFFTGNNTGRAPSFVTSSEQGAFEAKIVTDQSIIKRLNAEARYRPAS